MDFCPHCLDDVPGKACPRHPHAPLLDGADPAQIQWRQDQRQSAATRLSVIGGTLGGLVGLGASLAASWAFYDHGRGSSGLVRPVGLTVAGATFGGWVARTLSGQTAEARRRAFKRILAAVAAVGVLGGLVVGLQKGIPWMEWRGHADQLCTSARHASDVGADEAVAILRRDLGDRDHLAYPIARFVDAPSTETLADVSEALARQGVTLDCPELTALVLNVERAAARKAEAERLELEAACDRSQGTACYELGHRRYTDKDYPAADSFLKKGCAAGDSRSCVLVAVFMEKGLGQPPQREAAVLEYARLCSAHVPQACLRRAERLVEDQHGEPSPDSNAFFRMACDGSLPHACYLLGRALLAPGALHDEETAAELFAQACRGGDQDACSFTR